MASVLNGEQMDMVRELANSVAGMAQVSERGGGGEVAGRRERRRWRGRELACPCCAPAIFAPIQLPPQSGRVDDGLSQCSYKRNPTACQLGVAQKERARRRRAHAHARAQTTLTAQPPTPPNPQKNPTQQHPVLRPFLIPHTFVRYLRARQWDLAKAEAMLRATLKWRLDFRPHDLTWRDVEREACTGKLFVSPHPDIDGRPVVVMRPRHENSRDRDGQLRLLVYVLEVGSRRADAAVSAAAAAAASSPSPSSSSHLPDGKICILIDFERYGLSNAPPIRTALATLEILQSHYPERLGKSICWRAPALFSVTWRAVGPLVDPVTRQKIAFVDDAASVEEHFDPEHVEECCGGRRKGELFEKEAYAAAMQREEGEREAARAKADRAYPGGFLPSGSSDASAASLVALAGGGGAV